MDDWSGFFLSIIRATQELTEKTFAKHFDDIK